MTHTLERTDGGWSVDILTLLVLFVGGVVLVCRSVIVVQPGQRVLVWKRFGDNAGRVRVLESGAHFINALTWAVFGQGPFSGLIKSFPTVACPVPFSTVVIDPDRVEIMSADNVPGTANIALELQVLEWSPSEIININVPFRNRAAITVNQWVSNQLSTLSAAKMCSYAEVVSCLNDRTALKVLNDQLRDCYLEAKRISVDPSGIQLHREYASTVGVAIQRSRAIDLQRLETQAVQEAAERRLKLQLMETQSQCEVAKLQAEVERMIEKTKADALSARANALISAGLSAQHTANILVSEVSVLGLSKAQRVVVGMPQGLIGLRGIDSVHADVSHEVFEKV